MSSSNSDELGEMFEVVFYGGVSAYLALSEFERIDTIWREYVSSGKTRDQVVCADTQGTGEFSFLLSEVRFFDKTTRDVRRRVRERDLAFKAERIADGIIDSD